MAIFYSPKKTCDDLTTFNFLINIKIWLYVLVYLISLPIIAEEINGIEPLNNEFFNLPKEKLLPSQILGENYDITSGQLSFTQEDINIPGNNNLEVSVRRVHKLSQSHTITQDFGDWALDLPYITTSLTLYPSVSGYVKYSGPWGVGKECTGSLDIDRHLDTFGRHWFSPHVYNGTHIYIPGKGSEYILENNGEIQRGGDLITASGLQINCISREEQDNIFGQGFEVKAPDGRIYIFDQLKIVGKPHPEYGLYRYNAYMLLSKVYDRFGNFVEYHYSDSTRSQPFYTIFRQNNNQQYLEYIQASDGRRIDFNYENYGTINQWGYFLHKRIKSITANDKTWQYKYKDHIIIRSRKGAETKNSYTLAKVILPNNTMWEFEGLTPTLPQNYEVNENVYNLDPLRPMSRSPQDPLYYYDNCGSIYLDDYWGNITSPTGVIGKYKFSQTLHANEHDLGSVYAYGYSCITNWSLSEKIIHGAGLTEQNWQYEYSENYGAYGVAESQFRPYQIPELPNRPSQILDGQKYDFKSTTIIDPDNNKSVHYINRNNASFKQNKVLLSVVKDSLQNTVKIVSYDYELGPYIGNSGIGFGIDEEWAAAAFNLLQIEHQINFINKTEQIFNGIQKDTLTTQYSEFNAQGAATKITESNSFLNVKKYTKLGFRVFGGRLNQTYNFLWHLPTTVAISNDDINYQTISEITYHNVFIDEPEFSYQTIVPKEYKNYNVWQKKYSEYHTDGNIKTIEFNQKFTAGGGIWNSNNRFQTFTDYKRGIAQTLRVAKPYNIGTMTMLRVVDDNGWVTSTTDFNGNTTGFTYDNIGRIQAITAPNKEGEPNWADTLFTWRYNGGSGGEQPLREVKRCALNSAKKNCLSGSLKFTETTTYDALLRPIAVHTTDGNTDVYQDSRYNVYNKPTFTSYRSDTPTPLLGMHTSYDALQRIVGTRQDYGGLTKLAYLTGNKVEVTDAEDNVTTTTYLAYGSPSYEQATKIQSPEGVTTDIAINLYGNIDSIRQHSNQVLIVNEIEKDFSVDQTETRMYNSQQQLCMVKRSDVGNTYMHRNHIGEITWQAQGVSGKSCTTHEATDEQKVSFTYDNLGSQRTISYDDGTPTRTFTLDNNGNIKTITGQGFTQDYNYNSLNLLEDETLSISGRTGDLTLDYGYNSLGHLASLDYPDGSASIAFAPNGFGQATEVIRGDISTGELFASNAQYYPSGSINTFTYGNGVLHKTDLNSRLIPKQITDKYSGQDRVNLSYEYDDNSNITKLTNTREAGIYSLTKLSYDGLDRLKSTTGGSGIGSSSLTYDGLGNIRSYSNTSSFDAHDLTYSYSSDNRLSSVVKTGTSTKVRDFSASNSYDARGNVRKNGNRDSDAINSFSYNLANQMTEAGSNRYVYDGYNRRIKTTNSKGTSYSMYSQAGKLLYRETPDGGINYVFLGSKLIAKEGVGVKASDDSIMNYKPFGDSIETPKDDVGYTGHKFDTDLGLSYMQARYYDPVIGRFYSNDPVGFSNVHNFNRYAYANNNPYKYIDPDGQNALTAFGGLIHETGQFLQGNGFNGSMVMGALADGYNGEGSGFWAAAGEDALSFGGGIVGAAAKLGGFGKKAFDLASTFKGGKFKEVTLNPGTKLERAFEAGVNNPVAGFTTRGVTAQKLTSGQGASDVLALGGTSNAVPTHVSSLVVTQKTTAKMGFIAGSSSKNAVQIVVDNAQGALKEVSRRGINQ